MPGTGNWHLNCGIFLWQSLRCAFNDEAHVIKPEPGAAETALAADNRGTWLNVFETEI